MARDFDGSLDKLSHATALITAAPFTLAGWFNSDSIIANQAIISLGDTGGFANYFELLARGVQGGDPVALFAADTASGASTVNTTTGFSATTWHHACGVLASSTDRRVFIDGGSKGTSTDDRSPSGLDVTAIGVFSRQTDSSFFNGRLAEVAIWNVALSDAEVAILGGSPVSPLLIRPDALIHYWPIIGRDSSEIDRVGGADMTVTSAPPAFAHPRIFYPSGHSLGTGTLPAVAQPSELDPIRWQSNVAGFSRHQAFAFPGQPFLNPYIAGEVAAGGFVPYPYPRYTMAGGMQSMKGGM